MLESYIKTENGAPRLFISGKVACPMAYTTYFEERSAYRDFIKAGYRIFFVNVSFTTLPINCVTGFTPFNVGVFEDPARPDYSELDDTAKKILKECENAVIFPRVYVSMPKWWIDEHPMDVVETLGGYRESLFSEAFRRDGEKMLLELVEHVKGSDYASRVGGWQLCGGSTQEWFHHDRSGSLNESAREPFAEWVKREYGDEINTLPTLSDYEYGERTYQDKENARRYSLFSNLEVAKTLDCFANALKRATDQKQVVGAFYGYATQANGTPLFGTHGLRSLLDSENIDFLSAPNAYSENRAFGIDWADMIPVDSIKLHGKLAFIECDIRTYLTCGVQEARPGKYPDHIYRLDNGKSVWSGPPTVELSLYALKKCFAHQLAKQSAIWWFDMWGGWYDDPALMAELERMKLVYDEDINSVSDEPGAEIAFLADESGYANLLKNSPEILGIESTRTAMGNIGAPYDTYLVEDAPLILKNYKAVVFPCPIPSDAAGKAMAICEELKIPYLSATADSPILSSAKIREFVKSCGVHLYSESDEVVYAGGGYLAVHSKDEKDVYLRLPRKMKLTPLLQAVKSEQLSDEIKIKIKANDTVIMKLEKE